MVYVFRTDGPWGVGIGQNLTPVQVDTNFWQAIQDIAAKAPQGVGIAGFSVTGNLMTVVMTDHTLMGPYTLPVANLVFKGEWIPEYSFFTNDIITHVGSTYIVLMNHVSAATFDPGANDGDGHDYYGLLLQNPEMVVPGGGAVGSFLRKTTTTDFTMAWQSAALQDLSNVTIASPVNGEALTYSRGGWINAPSQIGSGLSIESSSPLDTGQPLAYNGTTFTNTSTVDLPWSVPSGTSGTVTVDRSAGEVQQLTLTGNTTLSIVGWPSAGQFARMVLQIDGSGGSYTVTWPSGTTWPGGTPPTMSANGIDIYIFMSFDGGATVFGNVVGQNYF